MPLHAGKGWAQLGSELALCLPKHEMPGATAGASQQPNSPFVHPLAWKPSMVLMSTSLAPSGPSAFLNSSRSRDTCSQSGVGPGAQRVGRWAPWAPHQKQAKAGGSTAVPYHCSLDDLRLVGRNDAHSRRGPQGGVPVQQLAVHPQQHLRAQGPTRAKGHIKFAAPCCHPSPIDC